MGELTDSGNSSLDAASEIRQELELHVAQCAAELERSGMSRVEAIAEANRRFGNFDSHFEACRREAPEERMNRAMKIGMLAMTVVLLAAVAYLGALVAMQRHALNEMKHFISEFSADPVEVALAEARMAGAVPEATLAGQVAKPGMYPVDPDGGTEAEAFLRSAGILLEDEFALGMRLRIAPKFAASERTLAWQRQGLPVRFEIDGSPSVAFPFDRSGAVRFRPIVTAGDRVSLEQSDTGRRGMWSYEVSGNVRKVGTFELPPSVIELRLSRAVELSEPEVSGPTEVCLFPGARGPERLKAWERAGHPIARLPAGPCLSYVLTGDGSDPGESVIIEPGDRILVQRRAEAPAPSGLPGPQGGARAPAHAPSTDIPVVIDGAVRNPGPFAMPSRPDGTPMMVSQLIVLAGGIADDQLGDATVQVHPLVDGEARLKEWESIGGTVTRDATGRASMSWLPGSSKPAPPIRGGDRIEVIVRDR